MAGSFSDYETYIQKAYEYVYASALYPTRYTFY